mmetsp:Transcript_95154/g.254338  ORF Transcript_95154/g.254338 Transcript_95154/m.254338 type:complete len:108 (-) Transcript_95154:30-353(-)
MINCQLLEIRIRAVCNGRVAKAGPFFEQRPVDTLHRRLLRKCRWRDGRSCPYLAVALVFFCAFVFVAHVSQLGFLGFVWFVLCNSLLQSALVPCGVFSFCRSTRSVI